MQAEDVRSVFRIHTRQVPDAPRHHSELLVTVEDTVRFRRRSCDIGRTGLGTFWFLLSGIVLAVKRCIERLHR